jgi:hypothetical protein
MNIYTLVDQRAKNFIKDSHKTCYINKKNATSIQKLMLEKYNTPLQLVEFEVADSLLFEMDENININDDKYKWKDD